MRLNLQAELKDEIEWHISNFVAQGWENYNSSCLCKSFSINSDKHDNEILIGLILEPTLLRYDHITGVNGKKIYEDVTCSWISGKIIVNSELLTEDLVQLIKEDIKNLPVKPFYDEDAYFGIFTKPRKVNSHDSEFTFYINKDYPKGYWQNHIL